VEKTTYGGALLSLLLTKFFGVIKSRRIRWAANGARVERGEMYTGFLVEKPEGKRPLGRPNHGLENNIKMDSVEAWTGSSWPRIGTGGGHL